MGRVTAPAPLETEKTESAEEVFAVPEPDVPWVTIVHNDPVNLMSYVTYVFQSYFGYSEGQGHQADARRPPQGPGRGLQRHA